jgi:hypothetical protein
MNHWTVRIAVATAGALLAGAPVHAEDAAAPDTAIGADGSATNGLIFKKRSRRQYNSKVTMDGADAAPAAPVEPKAGPAREPDAVPEAAPERSSLIGRSKVPTMMQNPAGSARKAQRAAKDRKRDEEDWLLSPQQRVQKEIDLLSGKADEEEESSGWLADDVESLREEKTKKMEERSRQEAEEEEAAEIAAIMGRDLFGSAGEKTSLRGLKREDRGGPMTAFGSAAREQFGSAMTNSLSAPELRIRDADPEEGRMSDRADGNPRQTIAQPRAADGTAAGPAKTGSELQKLNERYTGTSPETQKEAAAAEAARDATGGTARKPEGKTDTPSGASGGIPSPFAWNSSSGGGYAGLPSSLAPSIMPPAGASGAGGTSYRSLPGSGQSPSLARPDVGRGWAAPPPSSGAGLSPRVDMRPPVGQPARSPFMNPTASGLQGSGGYGTLPGPRP